MVDAKNKQTGNAETKPAERAEHTKNPIDSASAIKPQSEPPHGHYEITCKPEKNWWSKTKPLVEIAGAIILAIYTYYTAKMYRANKKAAEAATNAVILARDNAHLDQRAWLGVDSVGGLPEVGKRFIVEITFKNSGRTPALNAVVHSVYEPALNGDALHFDWENTKAVPESVGIIPPNGERIFEIDPNQGLKLKKGDLSLFVTHQAVYFGLFTYDDIFQCHHWLTYCSKMQTGRLRYASCDTHNDTDRTACEH